MAEYCVTFSLALLIYVFIDLNTVSSMAIPAHQAAHYGIKYFLKLIYFQLYIEK